jgi:hypothetical protein
MARQPADHRLQRRGRGFSIEEQRSKRRLLVAPYVDDGERDGGRQHRRDRVQPRPAVVVPEAEHNELPLREMAQSREKEGALGERVRLQSAGREVVPAWPEALKLRGRADVDHCGVARRKRVHRANLQTRG